MSANLAGDKTVADARHIFILAIKGTANSLISWGELADLINGPPALHAVRPPEKVAP